jgi:hypothetical protein
MAITEVIRTECDKIDAHVSDRDAEIAALSETLGILHDDYDAAVAEIARLQAIIDGQTPPPPPPPPPPTTHDYFIAPDGTGDGSTEATAAALSTLDSVIASGKRRIALIADRGDYSGTVTLEHGGEPGSPVIIEGIRGLARFVGTRNNGVSDFNSNRDIGDGTTIWKRPWVRPVNQEGWQPINAASWGSQGNELFRLAEGANYLTLRNFDAVRRSRVFNLVGQVHDIRIEDFKAYNIDSFLYMAHTGTAGCRNVSIARGEVVGCSSELARWRGSSETLRITDVVCDSAWQTGGKFFMGLFVLDTAGDVVCEGVTMMNGMEPNGFDDTRYAQGDGFVGERGTWGIVLRRCTAIGFADGGFDLKTKNLLMDSCVGERCKFNFRVRGDGTTLINCVSKTPQKLRVLNKDYTGGSGTTGDLEVVGGSADQPVTVHVINCPTITRISKVNLSTADKFYGSVEIA